MSEQTTEIEDLAAIFAAQESSAPKEGETPSADITTPESAPSGVQEMTVEQLLADEKLRPKLQSWKDSEAAKMLKGKERELTQRLTPDIMKQAQLDALKIVFDNMDEDDLKDLLVQKPELAQAFAEVKARDTAPPKVDDNEIETRATIRAYATSMRTWHQTVLNSDLDEATKASLDPETFLKDKVGEEGFLAWTTAINRAIIDSNVAKGLKEQTEAAIQDRLAKEETTPGGALLTPGSRTSPVPDLMTTDSDVLLHQALQSSGAKK